jgi:pimeloyl-ACP methyl ester carboxylesterase
MDQVEIGGLRITYRRAGEGPPLVLLHGGFGFDSRSWRRQLDSLSDEFTVVAWDAPGFGGSSDPPATFRLPDYADCLAGFIGALGLESPHVLGLSFGAALALELYRRHPAVPQTLVLAGGYAGWAGSLPPEVVKQRLEQAVREEQIPPEEWVPNYVPGMVTELAPSQMVEEITALMLDVHPAANLTALRGMAEADLRDVLPRIRVPTLLLYGEADKRSPIAVANELHAQIPKSTLVVVPGAGHLINFEAADRFDEEVRSFLRNHLG